MKIMVLGSGTDRIGKTGELDRFAVQALRFLKRERHEVIWVDNNPVTLASVPNQSTRVFIEPLTLKLLEKIIEQERPEGIMHCFGGCLATHLVIFLGREGILDRYGVRVLGTAVPTLNRFMDAEIFRKRLRDRGVPLMDAAVAHSVEECVLVSRSIGFPLILRPSFALEGIGGYLAYNVEEVKQLAHLALNLSPVQEVLLEHSPVDWVQLAIECIYDPNSPGKVHLVGTFEALDGGVGVHPGNSVVVTPAPTLMHSLLENALHLAGLIASTIEICGSFQVRFAISPGKSELVVLRVIHNLNRFSSLLSILNCIPLAEINASLSLGTSFEEMNQKLDLRGLSRQRDTSLTVARVPIFPDELQGTDIIDSTMRSTGAAVFFGRTLSVAMAKAIDSMFVSGFFEAEEEKDTDSEENHLTSPTGRLLKIIRMLEQDDHHYRRRLYTGVNPAFSNALKEVASFFRRLRVVYGGAIPNKLIGESKVAGFSDDGISHLTGLERGMIGQVREKAEVHPYLASILPDTHPERNRLSIVSYHAGVIEENDERTRKRIKKSLPTILLLGPGHYRIGWGPEVDQALVQTATALKERGQRIVLVNNNPDAVSHDLGIMDSICLETPSLEVIESVLNKWSIDGVVNQFCPSIPDGLENLLKEHDVKVLGTPLCSLATIQNIPHLWKTLQEIGIPILSYAIAQDQTSVLSEAANIGYPILVRLTDNYLNPEAEIMYDEGMLQHFLDLHQNRISEQTPLFMQFFQEGMASAEVLAICDGQKTVTVSFLENIEEYGIHSGDCASIIPALSIGDLPKALAEDALNRIASHFNIVGYLQIELAIKGRNTYVTAVRPYPSRNISFAEKAIGQSIHTWIARLFLGERIADLSVDQLLKPRRFYVKESVFPFFRFPGLDPILSPRMCSTGQVLGIDDTFGKAYLKSQMAVSPEIPLEGKVFLSARDTEKEAILQISKKLLELGFSLISTQGTARFLAERGIEVTQIHKVSGWRPNIIDLIKNGEISLVINIPAGFQPKKDEQVIRRVAIEHNIPLITTTSGAFLFVRGIEEIRKSPFTSIPLEG